jgi:tRNA threonylcarbamoyladenosine biosynthesis protein TsaE
MAEYITNSADETMLLGKKLGNRLPANSVVCFFGDLGAGKTTFIKGLASAAAECDYEDVNSPTFVYLNIYEGIKKIFHFDLYRLKGHEDFLGMGFDEYLYAGGICCIEWSERIQSFLPEDCLKVSMVHIGESRRKISIAPWDENG